jgi:hypothetical protein
MHYGLNDGLDNSLEKKVSDSPQGIFVSLLHSGYLPFKIYGGNAGGELSRLSRMGILYREWGSFSKRLEKKATHPQGASHSNDDVTGTTS